MNGGITPDVFLLAGEFYFGRGQVRVRTVLGTCVAITLWHPGSRVGGICHYLLPKRGRGPSAADLPPGYYAQDAMRLFANEVRLNRTRPDGYVVGVFGGGHMFPDLLTNIDCRSGACTNARREVCQSIGCLNICFARSALAGEGYMISSESVGGHGSRQVAFELATGEVSVKRAGALSLTCLIGP
jgi:chemotaxis protein CheD